MERKQNVTLDEILEFVLATPPVADAEHSAPMLEESSPSNSGLVNTWVRSATHHTRREKVTTMRLCKLSKSTGYTRLALLTLSQSHLASTQATVPPASTLASGGLRGGLQSPALGRA